MSLFRWVSVLFATVIALTIVACASPATVPTPTATPVTKPTAAPSPTPIPSSDGCIKCHSDKETLKKLAVDKVTKSAETQGEG